MMRSASILALLSSLALLAGCGSGDAGSSTAGPVTLPLLLTFDTAAGFDAVVTVQVAAVALERADGTATGNLLPAPQALRVADPLGAPTGLQLIAAPAGDYTAVHLITAPGSALAHTAAGPVPVQLADPDLRAAFAAPVRLGGGGWIDVRHDAPLGLTARGGALAGALELVAARASERASFDVTLTVDAVAGDTLLAVLDGGGAQVVAVLDDDAALHDDEGRTVDAAAFAAGCAAGAVVDGRGVVLADDHLHLREGRLGRPAAHPRLIGRIAELLPDRSAFVLRVQAVNRAGVRDDLDAPRRVTVRATDARITWSRTDRELRFADLQLDDLAKVTIAARVDDAAVVDATRIEITGRDGAPLPPMWHGIARAVRPDLGELVLGPLGDRPFALGDRRVERLPVRITDATAIERFGDRGVHAIRLADIAPDQDRVQVRGEVARDDQGAPFVRARSLRVHALR
ncbi:MAG: hypothetical protein AB7O97_09525 [Planctomycetota bacterium]